MDLPIGVVATWRDFDMWKLANPDKRGLHIYYHNDLEGVEFSSLAFPGHRLAELTERELDHIKRRVKR